MKLNLHKAPLFLATLLMLCTTGADATETAESTTGTAPGVVVKVEKAVERGAKAAARGVERGAKATGNAAHTVTKKVGGSPTPSSSPDKPDK